MTEYSGEHGPVTGLARSRRSARLGAESHPTRLDHSVFLA